MSISVGAPPAHRTACVQQEPLVLATRGLVTLVERDARCGRPPSRQVRINVRSPFGKLSGQSLIVSRQPTVKLHPTIKPPEEQSFQQDGESFDAGAAPLRYRTRAKKITPGARGAAVTSPTPLRTPPPKDGGAAEPGDLSGRPCVFLRTPPKAGGDTMPQSCKIVTESNLQAGPIRRQV